MFSTTPDPVSPNDSGSDILYVLDENRLNDIPVVKNQRLIGSIQESQIYTFDDPDKPVDSQKISLKRAFVYDFQHVLEVLRVMNESELSVLPVLDHDEQYLGCITHNQVVKEMGTILDVKNPGAFIVLEINQNDIVLSQIAQIVESQDAKVLNLFITDSSDSTKSNVIIKVNTMEIQTLVQTFNRYNYIIKATYTEDEKMQSDLRDRYDGLMRYLNV
jgi:predicted transcriptional regulator